MLTQCNAGMRDAKWFPSTRVSREPVQVCQAQLRITQTLAGEDLFWSFNTPSWQFSFKFIFQGKIWFLSEIHISPHLLSTETLMAVRENSAWGAGCAVCSLIFNTETFSIYQNAIFCTPVTESWRTKLKLNSGQRPDPVTGLSSVQTQCRIKPSVISWEVKRKKKVKSKPSNSQHLYSATPKQNDQLTW